MVFVLPAVQRRDFGTELAAALGKAGTDIGTAYSNKRQDSKDEEILSSINETSSPIDIIKTHARLSKKGQEASATLLDQYLKQSNAYEERKYKEQTQLNEKSQKLQGTNKIIDRLEELKGEVGSALGTSGNNLFGTLNRNRTKLRAEIDVLGQDMERVVRELTTKGQLSGTVYENIQKYVPKSKDSPDVYQGKLDGFRRLLNEGENPSSSEPTTQEQKKIEPSKEQIQQIKHGLPLANKGMVWVLNPEGQPVQIPKDQINSALSSGGTRL